MTQPKMAIGQCGLYHYTDTGLPVGHQCAHQGHEPTFEENPVREAGRERPVQVSPGPGGKGGGRLDYTPRYQVLEESQRALEAGGYENNPTHGRSERPVGRAAPRPAALPPAGDRGGAPSLGACKARLEQEAQYKDNPVHGAMGDGQQRTQAQWREKAYRLPSEVIQMARRLPKLEFLAPLQSGSGLFSLSEIDAAMAQIIRAQKAGQFRGAQQEGDARALLNDLEAVRRNPRPHRSNQVGGQDRTDYAAAVRRQLAR